MEDGKNFLETSSDYARIHGNKPATVGFAVGSSTVELLAW